MKRSHKWLASLLVVIVLASYWWDCCREFEAVGSLSQAALELRLTGQPAVPVGNTGLYMSINREQAKSHLRTQGWELVDYMGDMYSFEQGRLRMDTSMGQCSRFFVVWGPGKVTGVPR